MAKHRTLGDHAKQRERHGSVPLGQNEGFIRRSERKKQNSRSQCSPAMAFRKGEEVTLTGLKTASLNGLIGVVHEDAPAESPRISVCAHSLLPFSFPVRPCYSASLPGCPACFRWARAPSQRPNTCRRRSSAGMEWTASNPPVLPRFFRCECQFTSFRLE